MSKSISIASICLMLVMTSVGLAQTPTTLSITRTSDRMTHRRLPIAAWKDVVNPLTREQILKVFPGEGDLLDKVASGWSDEQAAQATLKLVARTIDRRKALQGASKVQREDAKFAFVSAWHMAAGLAHLTSDERARTRVLDYWSGELSTSPYPVGLMLGVAEAGDNGFITPAFMDYFTKVRDDNLFAVMCDVLQAHGSEKEMKLLEYHARTDTNEDRGVAASIAAAELRYQLAPEDQKSKLIPVSILQIRDPEE